METMLGSADNGGRDKAAYVYSGGLLGRFDPRTSAYTIMPDCILPCKDGYVQFRAMPFWWPRYLDMLAGGDKKKREELEKQFPNLFDLSKWDESLAVCLQWLGDRTKQEAMEEAQKYRVACMKVSTPEDLVKDKHFQTVKYWVNLEHPVAGEFLYPGPPTKLEACPAQIKRPAPLLGQHTEEVLTELGYNKDELVELRSAGVI